MKLQKRDNRRLYTRALYDSPYDNENSFGPTYGAHREALELDRDAYVELRDEARSSASCSSRRRSTSRAPTCSRSSTCPAFKIASGDLTEHAAAPSRRRARQAARRLDRRRDDRGRRPRGRGDHRRRRTLCLLQCTAAYPAAVEDLNLGVIATLRERYPELVIGLSDHQDGIAMAPVAYMLGARVIEKHFTLSHTAKGTDHAFSLMPEGMRKLVRDLRRVPDRDRGRRQAAAAERGEAAPEDGEEARRGATARGGARPRGGGPRGEVAGRQGLPPYLLDDLLGRPLVRALEEDEAILAADVARTGSTAATR